MLFIDYKSSQPIYEQVYNGIVRMALHGALQPGGQLPSVRSIAADAGVNPNTVQKAYAMLERDGIIYSVPGKGSFLAEEKTLLAHRRQTAIDAVLKAVDDALNGGVHAEELEEAIAAHIRDGRRTS